MFEDPLGTSWSAYTDHNPVEVKQAKGWVSRAPPKPTRRLRRPNWAALRGTSNATTTARSAFAVEMDRRVTAEQPSSWQDVVELGLGVARAVLGEEPKRDPRPWVRGGEAELLFLDQAVSGPMVGNVRRRRRSGTKLMSTFDGRNA